MSPSGELLKPEDLWGARMTVDNIVARFLSFHSASARKPDVSVIGFDGSRDMEIRLGTLYAISGFFHLIDEILEASQDYDLALAWWTKVGIPGECPDDRDQFFEQVLRFYFTTSSNT